MKYEVDATDDEKIEVKTFVVKSRLSVKDVIALTIAGVAAFLLLGAAGYGLYSGGFEGLGTVWDKAEPIVYTLVGYCFGKIEG